MSNADLLKKIAEGKANRRKTLIERRDAALKTSARDIFIKLNAEADRLAQGLTGRYREEYEARRAQRLADADARDRETKAGWDKIIAKN